MLKRMHQGSDLLVFTCEGNSEGAGRARLLYDVYSRFFCFMWEFPRVNHVWKVRVKVEMKPKSEFEKKNYLGCWQRRLVTMLLNLEFVMGSTSCGGSLYIYKGSRFPISSHITVPPPHFSGESFKNPDCIDCNVFCFLWKKSAEKAHDFRITHAAETPSFGYFCDFSHTLIFFFQIWCNARILYNILLQYCIIFYSEYLTSKCR